MLSATLYKLNIHYGPTCESQDKVAYQSIQGVVLKCTLRTEFIAYPEHESTKNEEKFLALHTLLR